MKKCIYCKKEVEENSVIDFCSDCGKGVWGEKMFDTIVKSMQDAKERGDLMQGSVEDNYPKIARR